MKWGERDKRKVWLRKFYVLQKAEHKNASLFSSIHKIEKQWIKDENDYEW